MSINRTTLNTILVVLWIILALFWLLGGVGGLSPSIEHLFVFFMGIVLVR